MTQEPDPHPLTSTRVRRLEGGTPPHLDPTLTRVRRGYYRGADREPDPAEAHRLRIIATAQARVTDLVFSHASAAVLWGCPQLVPELAVVHAIQPGRARRTTAGVLIHRSAIPEEHFVELADGLTVTSRAWTAVCLAAATELPGVLLPLDHLVRELIEETGQSLETVQDELLGLVPRGMKGRQRALRHLRLADGRSGSAGESLSRGQMVRLGVPAPELQVAFPHPDGQGQDIVDFDWPSHGVFGEFDGKAKYVDPRLTGGRAPADVLWAEKEREDRIRRERPRGARWGWDDARSLPRLGKILRQAGIEPVSKLSP